MRIRITRTMNCFETRKEQEEMLEKYPALEDYNAEIVETNISVFGRSVEYMCHTYIQLEGLEDFVKLSDKLKENIIFVYKNYPDVPYLEIYDDYRE